MNRPMVYRFVGWNGRDFWRNWLSEKRQARAVARMLLAGDWKGSDPDTTPLIIYMPVLTYRIIDTRGHVEVVQGDAVIRGLRLF